MVVRSLIDKTQSIFSASVAEVGTQEAHQTLTLGVAVVSGDASHARNMMDNIIRFMETSADAELVSVDEE
jgi:hypothetical protein